MRILICEGSVLLRGGIVRLLEDAVRGDRLSRDPRRSA